VASSLKRLFIYGFPSFYGGAGTELHHQIMVWLKMGLEVHIIPTNHGYRNEALYGEMIERGVHIYSMNDWAAIEAGDPVFGFCNSEYLDNLDEIYARTRRTVFVNCMTWLFDKEKERMKEGKIGMFLYQNEAVRQKSMPELQDLNNNPEIQFATFKAYFDTKLFPFIQSRSNESFGCGRISRQDADKFAANTLKIYENFVSPKPKKGMFLGFNYLSERKIGKPFEWITIGQDQTEISQQDFYRHCEIILQPSDTTENWPRIGFEAMASGSILIVDNRGGWQQMVKHGETGWLCDNESDFIYYASKMAYEPNLRAEMASAAGQHGQKLGGMEQSIASWKEIFERIDKLPL